MLEYRVRRLPAALAAARSNGRSGARFAWESAADGSDVTPSTAVLPTGARVAIRTGELEEHIVADVAWAASHYLDWTGDAAFEAGGGGQLIVETARYWSSRVRYDGDGRAHILGVIGPDEYHEPVDDNAYTNVIARWNLRRAARIPGVDERERRTWLEIADALVDGYDETSGLYEQFAGFFELEPIVIAEVVPRRPVAADLLLGAERTAGAQVLKQADVLMLHHLVPDEVAADSLAPNLDYYEPRTAHGSSLSPAIHAALLARAGRYRAALGVLAVAARLDLDDLTGTTAAGLHLATMGGLGRLSPLGSEACASATTASSSTHASPSSGTRSSSGCASAAIRSGSGSTEAVSASTVTPSTSSGRTTIGRSDHDERRACGDRQQPRVQVGARDRARAGRRVRGRRRGDPRSRGRRSTGRGAADAAHVRLRTVEGPVIESLIEAGELDAVVAVVIGSRRLPDDRRPLGATALAIASKLSKPVVVVPPHARPLDAIRRVLVPLEGTRPTSLAPRSIIEIARGTDVEVVALHILDTKTIPAFTDQPQHEQTAWAREFLARYCPWGIGALRFETRVGASTAIIPEFAEESETDLIALGWAQDLAPGRAPVVRATLGRGRIPVMLHTRGAHSVARAVGVNRALGVESGTCRRVPEARRSGITCGRRSLIVSGWYPVPRAHARAKRRVGVQDGWPIVGISSRKDWLSNDLTRVRQSVSFPARGYLHCLCGMRLASQRASRPRDRHA